MKASITVFVMLLFFQGVDLQNDWILKKDKENIQIYVKNVDGYNMKAYKGVTELETSVSNVVAVLLDVPGFVDWMPKTKEVKAVEKKGEAELVYYVHTEAPWPVNDRDGVYSIKASNDTKTGTVLVKTGCQPDRMPKKSGVVRITHSEGFWKLIPLSNGKVKVIYQNHSDPGGSIPAWLVNSSVIDVPFTTLQRIKNQVNLPKYQNQHFEFLR